jgi:hypothetical protein
VKNNQNTKYDKCHLNVSLEIFICFFKLFLFKYKITTLSVMQDSSHLTIILCSSIIKIVISQKQKFSRKNNNKTLQDCNRKFSNSHLTFVAICIPIVFHGTLENFIISWTTIKNCFIFLQSATDQTITFNTSLDSKKKLFQTEPKKLHMSI